MLTKRNKTKTETMRLNTPASGRKGIGKETDNGTLSNVTLEITFLSGTFFNILFCFPFNPAKDFFKGCPIGKKCFYTTHKFALVCKNCPTWQTLKTGATTTSEIPNPKTSTTLLLKTYPIYNRLKNIKGVVLIGRESDDVPMKWNR